MANSEEEKADIKHVPVLDCVPHTQDLYDQLLPVKSESAINIQDSVIDQGTKNELNEPRCFIPE